MRKHPAIEKKRRRLQSLAAGLQYFAPTLPTTHHRVFGQDVAWIPDRTARAVASEAIRQLYLHRFGQLKRKQPGRAMEPHLSGFPLCGSASSR